MLKNLIRMSPNLEPATQCGWEALVTQNNSLKSKTCSSEKSHVLKTPQGLHKEAGGLNLATENLGILFQSSFFSKWSILYHNFHHKPSLTLV